MSKENSHTFCLDPKKSFIEIIIDLKEVRWMCKV